MGKMMTALLCALCLLGAGVPAPAQSRPLPVPPLHLEMDGFSILPPNEKGWHRVNISPGRLDLARDGRKKDESYGITVLVTEIPETDSAEALLELVEDYLANQSESDRFRNHEHEAAVYEGEDTPCVRAVLQAEDHAAVKRSRKRGPMILEAVTLFCRHPEDSKRLVSFAYTHRHYPGMADRGLAGRADRFFQDVGFTDILTFEEEEAVEEVRDRARKGDPQAQYDVARMYERGDGLQQELRAAVRWYRRAGDQGHTAAQVRLGVLYGESREMPRDYLKAYMWLAVVLETTPEEEEEARREARAALDRLEGRLPRSMIAEGQALAERWLAEHP